MGSYQNYGPSFAPYLNTAPNIQGTQKGTVILTTTHVQDRPARALCQKEAQSGKTPGLGRS